MIPQWRFERAIKRLSTNKHAVLRDYANADWPSPDTPACETRYLALDFELDGLRKDSHLLQAGFTTFQGTGITLDHARSLDIRSTAALDNTAVTIHGIGEQRAAAGEPLAQVIHLLIRALSGRVLIAHSAGIEVHALRRSSAKLFGVNLPIRSICTLELERRLNPNLVGEEDYRLGKCRERYGLPEYRAHDALTDAIAAAELFQAQLTHLSQSSDLSSLERY